MKLDTVNVNNTFRGTIVIPIPQWIAKFRWLDINNRLDRHIIISWGKSNNYVKIWYAQN